MKVVYTIHILFIEKKRNHKKKGKKSAHYSKYLFTNLTKRKTQQMFQIIIIIKNKKITPDIIIIQQIRYLQRQGGPLLLRLPSKT